MSAQRLGDKKLRKLQRDTGLPIVRAWAFGGYSYAFVVGDPHHPDLHRHGHYDLKTGEWEFSADDAIGGHFTTCHEMFPGVEKFQSAQRLARLLATESSTS